MNNLVGLALLPAVLLMVYIYKKDKKEKEPMSKLLKCFLWGVVSVIPAIAIELFLENVLQEGFSGSVLYLIIENFFIVALTEEGCKYFFLNKVSRKNTYFDFFFDGIVYSVFVSMGFAAAENILYVLQDGFYVAITRMFTAVPGHMCFAIYMGYYYSRKLYCELCGDKKAASHFAKRALWVAVIIHGFYDFLLEMPDNITTLIWIVGVIILFIFSFKFVNRASKEDIAFFEPSEEPSEAAE